MPYYTEQDLQNELKLDKKRLKDSTYTLNRIRDQGGPKNIDEAFIQAQSLTISSLIDRISTYEFLVKDLKLTLSKLPCDGIKIGFVSVGDGAFCENGESRPEGSEPGTRVTCRKCNGIGTALAAWELKIKNWEDY